MTDSKILIILGILLVSGFFFFKEFQPEPQALISIDSASSIIPKGVGYGDLLDQSDGLYDGFNGQSPESAVGCGARYGNTCPLDAPNCAVNQCSTICGVFDPIRSADITSLNFRLRDIGGTGGTFTPPSCTQNCDRVFAFSDLVCVGKSDFCTGTYNHVLIDPSTSIGTDTGVLEVIDKEGEGINIRLKIADDNLLGADIETPLFFEGSLNTLAINLNPNPLLGAFTPERTYIFAWLESEIPNVGSARQDAISKFGKPIIFSDLSRLYQLSNSPQIIEFDLGQLPIGEYNFYAIITAMGSSCGTSGQERSGCELVSRCTPGYKPLTPLIHSNFLVNPAPLTKGVFENQECGDRYEFQIPQDEITPPEDPDGDGLCNPLEGHKTCTCVRNDVKDLPCARLTAPITINQETGEVIPYACGSDGFFSEIIFVNSLCETNEDCGPNQICDKTLLENGTGTCFNEDIIGQFIGFCTQDSDCWTANCKDSSGKDVTVSCVSNECSYSGTCDVDVTGDCRLLDCPTGFNCLESGDCVRIKEPPIDEEEEEEPECTIDSDCAENEKCINEVCTETTEPKKGITPFIIGGIIIIIGIGGYLIFFRK